MKSCQVARLLAYVTGMVNQELLLQVEYLAAENRILRAHAPARLRLSNQERTTLAEIRKGLKAEGSGESSRGGKTRDDSWLVREAGGAEVRWFEAPLVSRSAED
jgi:hypothetical protein